MKSIMHDKSRHTCYLCEKLHDDNSWKYCIEEHHVFHGTSNRKNAEKWGLKVYLCNDHHVYGKEAVHQRADIDLVLKQDGQRAFLKAYPDEDFISIFGKSFI